MRILRFIGRKKRRREWRRKQAELIRSMLIPTLDQD